jgi:predicted GNAT family acetyltransferase
MAPSDIAARLKRARTRSEYRYVPAEKAEDGLAKVMSRNGYTLAEDLGDGRLMVKNTTTRPEARGKGEATGRYKELISSAAAEGKQVVSGTTLTSGAQRVIARLNREGFVEKINPYRVNEKNGSWYSTDPRVPIIEFRKPQ